MPLLLAKIQFQGFVKISTEKFPISAGSVFAGVRNAARAARDLLREPWARPLAKATSVFAVSDAGLMAQPDGAEPQPSELCEELLLRVTPSGVMSPFHTPNLCLFPEEVKGWVSL